MKSTVLVLGIIGCVLALLSAYIGFSIGNSLAHVGEFVPADPAEYARQMSEPIEPEMVPLIVPGLMGFAGSAIAIAGTVLVRKRVPAGAFMFAGGILVFLSILGIPAAIVLFTGGALALIYRDNEQQIPIGCLRIMTLSLISVFIASALAFLHTVFASYISNEALSILDRSTTAKALFSFVSIAVGIAACVKLRKSPAVAGLLLIVSVFACLIPFYNISVIQVASAVLFTAGCILAFVSGHVLPSDPEDMHTPADQQR